MAFIDSNSSNIIENTHKWVNDGLQVEGIPFYHRIHELSFLEWEQLCTDMIFLLIFIFIAVKIIENSKILSILSMKVDILMNNEQKSIEKELSGT